MEIILIAAMATNGVIGRRGGIPWQASCELQRFKAITMGHTLVMGRRTYESIGGPLPGRTNIVISRQKNYPAPGCQVAGSLQAALSLCQTAAKVFICGGGEVYRAAMPLADAIYLSVLERKVEGDTFFPKIDASCFIKVREDKVVGPEPYSFQVYRRSNKTGLNYSS